MALAYLTINLDAFTGDDHPPVPSYSTITLDPGVDHIDAAADVIHVRTIVVSLDRQGKAATANGVPCVDGKVPVVAGVAYAVSAPNVLRGGPHYIPALTAGQVVDLSDYITPGAPLTPDQAAALAARVTALEATPPGGGGGGSLTYVTANTDIPDGTTPGQLVGYYNASAGSITVEGGTVAAGAHVILMWTGTAWQVLGGGTVTPTDTTPPTAVTTVTATKTDTTVTLTWPAASDTESSVSYGWRVYPTGSTPPAYTTTTTTTATKTGLSPSTDYVWDVYSYSTGGSTAPASGAVRTDAAAPTAEIWDDFEDLASGAVLTAGRALKGSVGTTKTWATTLTGGVWTGVGSDNATAYVETDGSKSLRAVNGSNSSIQIAQSSFTVILRRVTLPSGAQVRVSAGADAQVGGSGVNIVVLRSDGSLGRDNDWTRFGTVDVSTPKDLAVTFTTGTSTVITAFWDGVQIGSAFTNPTPIEPNRSIVLSLYEGARIGQFEVDLP